MSHRGKTTCEMSLILTESRLEGKTNFTDGHHLQLPFHHFHNSTSTKYGSRHIPYQIRKKHLSYELLPTLI